MCLINICIYNLNCIKLKVLTIDSKNNLYEIIFIEIIFYLIVLNDILLKQSKNVHCLSFKRKYI